MPDTVSDELIALRELKARRDDANKTFKELDAFFKSEQKRVMDRMDAEGYESAKADGTTFSPVAKEYASIQDRSSFVAWALENDPELVEYKERSEQLNALVRGRLDDGEELPPGVGFYTREYISMRSS